MEGFYIANKLDDDHIKDLCAMMRDVWWGGDRTVDYVRKIVENSDIIFAVIQRGSEKLIGFARVLTDYSVSAVIFDVIIHKGYRSCGLGSFVMKSIVGNPELKKCERLDLFCKVEMREYYKQFGFSHGSDPDLSFLRKERDS